MNLQQQIMKNSIHIEYPIISNVLIQPDIMEIYQTLETKFVENSWTLQQITGNRPRTLETTLAENFNELEDRHMENVEKSSNIETFEINLSTIV